MVFDQLQYIYGNDFDKSALLNDAAFKEYNVLISKTQCEKHKAKGRSSREYKCYHLSDLINY